MAHPGDNLNPFVATGVLVVIVAILSVLIVWAAGPIDTSDSCPCNQPPYDGFIVTP